MSSEANSDTMLDGQQHLLDHARAEDFSNQELKECYQDGDRERDIVLSVKGAGAHLIEGPRGVGKSTLFRIAEIEMDHEWPSQRVLAVYVNFKAALLVQNAELGGGVNPFLCWIGAKTLDAFHKKCRALNVVQSQEMQRRYQEYLGVNAAWHSASLDRLISGLQNLALSPDEESRKLILEKIRENGIKEISNVEQIIEIIRNIISEVGIKRVNFLFDEAAHTFDEIQQATFFNFFKLLHGDHISVKAAVYPGITSYGGNFEIGNDAVRITFNHFDENRDDGRRILINRFRQMLQKRVSGPDFGKMTKRGEALDCIILSSNGNPRAFLQIISKWRRNRELSKRAALLSVAEYINGELTEYHVGLRNRLPRFKTHISIGLDFLNIHLIPELQRKNEGKGAGTKIQTVYFTMDASIKQKMKKSINLLEYSGIISQRGIVKTAKRKSAPRYALHLGIAVTERIFHSKFARNPDHGIKMLSLTDYREFYASDKRFDEIINAHPEVETCPNGHERKVDGPFCPVCGKEFEVDSVIKTLLGDKIDKLSLTVWLKNKLSTDFHCSFVSDTLKLTEEDLKTAHMIGDVRARLIRNAAEEYITG